MPIAAVCPSCGRSGQVPDQFKGKVVSCPNCQKPFSVGGPPVQTAIATAPAALAPRPAAPVHVAPVAAPVGARKSATPLIAAALGAVLLCGAGGAAGVYWLMKPSADKSAPIAAVAAPDTQHTPEAAPAAEKPKEPAADLPKEPAPVAKAPVEAPPADPAPALTGNMPLATLEALKEATVFVKVETRHLSGSGSGFVIRVQGDSAFVVTNDHVVTPPKERGIVGKPAITLVFGSGTAHERSGRAEVVGTDPERDLAVLKMSGIKDLPKPIDFAATPALVETMPVYVFGFPFGKLLATGKGNPAITVGRGAVSSIRRNDRGKLAVVQIDGALNPGNSGGPVVDAQGRLVGVSVATIRGANNIGLAIPPDELHDLLAGRIRAVGVYRAMAKNGGGTDFQGELWLFNALLVVEKTVQQSLALSNVAPPPERAGVVHVLVDAVLLDPLENLRAAHVYYVDASQVKAAPRAGPDGRWELLPQAQKAELPLGGKKPQAMLTLPDVKGAEYYVQLSFDATDGKPVFTQPRTFRLERLNTPAPPPPVVDPRPTPAPTPAPPPPAVRATVPGAEALAKAERLVKDIYKTEYARKAPADRLALSVKLHEQSRQTRDDAAARFVLYREALVLAAQGGDFASALALADEFAREFEVLAVEWKTTVFEKAGPAVQAREACQGLTEEALTTVTEAVAADDFDRAARILKAADGVARRAQLSVLALECAASSKEIERIRVEFEKVKTARATLEKTPTDAAANLIVGKYHCFVKGAWERGLPLLAQGSDAPLKALAAQDQATPVGVDARLALGDAWYDYAATLGPALAKVQVQRRAAAWYQQTLPELAGLTKARVEKRMQELELVLEKPRGNGELFAIIADGLKNKRTKTTNRVGFTLAKEFQDMPPDAGLLIGFEVTLGKFINNDVIDTLRPIYRTARGERFGMQLGRPKTPALTVKAKPGYAVAAVTLKTGLGIDGFSMTFQKVDKTGLKKDDSYTSAWLGGKGGGRETTVGGDGAFVVGICGHYNDKTNPSALGLVTLSAPAPKPKESAAQSKEPDGPASDGKEFAPRNKMYTARMPGGDQSTQLTKVFTIGKHKVPIEGAQSRADDGTVFIAASVGIPAVVIREIPEDQRYDKARDSIAKQLKGKVAAERDIKQDVVPGKEYTIEGEKSLARMQLYIVRGWVMYAIVEGENKEQLTSPEAQAFFRAFKLSDEAKRLVK